LLLGAALSYRQPTKRGHKRTPTTIRPFEGLKQLLHRQRCASSEARAKSKSKASSCRVPLGLQLPDSAAALSLCCSCFGSMGKPCARRLAVVTRFEHRRTDRTAAMSAEMSTPLRPANGDEGVGSTHLFRVSLPASVVEDLSIAREQRSELRNMRF